MQESQCQPPGFKDQLPDQYCTITKKGIKIMNKQLWTKVKRGSYGFILLRTARDQKHGGADVGEVGSSTTDTSTRLLYLTQHIIHQKNETRHAAHTTPAQQLRLSSRAFRSSLVLTRIELCLQLEELPSASCIISTFVPPALA